MKSLAPAASFAAHAEPTLHNRPCTHGVTMTGVNERVYSSVQVGGRRVITMKRAVLVTRSRSSSTEMSISDFGQQTRDDYIAFTYYIINRRSLRKKRLSTRV